VAKEAVFLSLPDSLLLRIECPTVVLRVSSCRVVNPIGNPIGASCWWPGATRGGGHGGGGLIGVGPFPGLLVVGYITKLGKEQNGIVH
jgi:hypothetical protein